MSKIERLPFCHSTGMRVMIKINIGNIFLVDYIDFENEPLYPEELYSARELWEMFLNGDVDSLESDQWRDQGEEWRVVAEETTAMIKLGNCTFLRVEIPLALLKAEMRRVLEEHDAAVAAGGAEEAGE